MKRATFTLSNGEEVQGWQTSVPGLIAHKYEGTHMWGLYTVHGRVIAHAYKREHVERMAASVAGIDWTVDLDTLLRALATKHSWLKRRIIGARSLCEVGDAEAALARAIAKQERKAS